MKFLITKDTVGAAKARGYGLLAGAYQWDPRVWQSAATSNQIIFPGLPESAAQFLRCYQSGASRNIVQKGIQGQGSQKVFGGAWASHPVTYSLALTVDGCLLQGLGLAIGSWLGARAPQW